MQYTELTKEVTYDRLTRDFRVAVNGEYLGHTPTSVEGWELADEYVYQLLMDTAPAGAREGAA